MGNVAGFQAFTKGRRGKRRLSSRGEEMSRNQRTALRFCHISSTVALVDTALLPVQTWCHLKPFLCSPRDPSEYFQFSRLRPTRPTDGNSACIQTSTSPPVDKHAHIQRRWTPPNYSGVRQRGGSIVHAGKVGRPVTAARIDR